MTEFKRFYRFQFKLLDKSNIFREQLDKKMDFWVENFETNILIVFFNDNQIKINKLEFMFLICGIYIKINSHSVSISFVVH